MWHGRLRSKLSKLYIKRSVFLYFTKKNKLSPSFDLFSKSINEHQFLTSTLRQSWSACTGSLTMICAKVNAYINTNYWLSVSKPGFWASTTSGHLWKCKTNLSKSNGSKDMTFFSLVFQHFTVNRQIRVWKRFLEEKRSYLLNHLT